MQNNKHNSGVPKKKPRALNSGNSHIRQPFRFREMNVKSEVWSSSGANVLKVLLTADLKRRVCM